MAKKKGGGKKGGKGKKKGGKAPKVEEPPPPPPPPPPPVYVVRINYTMFPGSAPWNFLDFSEVVPVKTRIFWLRDCIVDRHGGSIDRSEISLYLDKPTNPLENLHTTLAAEGVTGFRDGTEDEEVAVTVYYDFSSGKALACPLLLSDPVTVTLRSEVEDESSVAPLDDSSAAPVPHRASSVLGFRD
eukprot:SAG22_NODE_1297_length_4813_cov_219.933602_3_plen_186_part_00